MSTNEFRDFMNKYRANENNRYTHTSQMHPYLGKFYIERSQMETFWKEYCDKVYYDSKSFLYGMSEKPNDEMPVLGDIDIQIENDETKEYNEPLYSIEQCKQIVGIYIDVLKFILKDIDYNNLVCFVLEKSKPYVNGPIVKNGFHIHFPFLFLSQVDQEIHLIPRVVKEVEERQIFSNLTSHSGDMIDKGVIKKHWLMYGSRKDIKLEAYRLTKIYDYKIREITLTNVMKNQTIFDSEADSIPILENNIPLEYYLPRILSVHPLHRPRGTIRDNIEIVVKQKLIPVKQLKGTVENMPIAEAVEHARRLTNLLSVKRASEHDTWLEIGWVLYNIGEGCAEALEIWLDFSKKTSRNNYNEATCVYEWNKMVKRNYTLGTLKHHAHVDNPEGYNSYVNEERQKHFSDSLNGGHFDLAKSLYDAYGQKYVCASLEKDLWYEFKDHRWVVDEKAIELKKKIALYLVPKFRDDAKGQYDHLHINGTEEDEKEIIEFNDKILTKIGKMNKMIRDLNTSGFKQSVMKECYELFYKKDFFDKLDTNPYLICFNNGILDLKTCTFRNGAPTDYCSLCCNYDFKEYNMDDIEVQDILLFFDKIFPDPILREYYYNYAASILRGGNYQKTFIVMSGDGDNGKSVVIELMEQALGEYAIKFPTTLLTGKRTQSSAASPELARIHGKRFAVMQEPDGKDVINGGVLKELTGNDTMYVRGLFKDGREVRPMFKLAFICNKLPRLSADDQATWNRVRVLMYESLFPKDGSLVPDTYEEQKEKKIFPRDNSFSERLPDMKTAFMWFIFNRYKELRSVDPYKVIDPPKVTEATKAYRENNDFVLQFINENIKEDLSPENQGLGITELFNTFKDWFQQTYAGTRCNANKVELNENFMKRWGKTTGGKWKKYRFKNLMDEEEEEKQNNQLDDDPDVAIFTHNV